MLFLNLDHQWKRYPNGKRAGLDYLALEAAAKLSGTELSPEDFALIQAMEREVLKPHDDTH